MSARMRILRNTAIVVAGLILFCAIAVVVATRTEWFREFARQKLLTAIEDGMGGRVEIGSFSFDPTRLHAVVNNIVVHGNEPSGAAPYLRARQVEVSLRFFSNLKFLDVEDLKVDQPQANILVAADGTTNIPRPKNTTTSKNTP